MTHSRILLASGAWHTVANDDDAVTKRSSRVIFRTRATKHRCQVCKKRDHWGPSWFAIARWGPRHAARGEGRDIYCSLPCLAAENPSWRPEKWMRTNEEPFEPATLRKIYQAQLEERKRKMATVEHRKCPLPKWLGDGYCKWCNEPMGKDCGRATMWHPACATQFKLHNVLFDQQRFLIARDGRKCAICGVEGLGEVDHIMALWKIRHLPPMRRIIYYGPINLWLLCWQCHKKKSAREAAQRAAANKT